MSASLVGSEMCIRDRTRTCPPWPGQLERPQPPRAPDRPRHNRPDRQCKVCLLYTSDAADDM
eukprot:7005894-Alexandrium_andersonii.AAC.1